MSSVFLDTVGLLALWDTSDQWHAAAEHAFRSFGQARCRPLTTTFVLLECGNAAARRPYRTAVDRLRQQMEAAGTLVTPTEEDWHEAWDGYRSSQVGGAGIVDHVSFVVMRRIGIKDAFTNDRHFGAAGFNTLF